jgi:hypothetical protein
MENPLPHPLMGSLVADELIEIIKHTPGFSSMGKDARFEAKK